MHCQFFLFSYTILKHFCKTFYKAIWTDPRYNQSSNEKPFLKLDSWMEKLTMDKWSNLAFECIFKHSNAKFINLCVFILSLLKWVITHQQQPLIRFRLHKSKYLENTAHGIYDKYITYKIIKNISVNKMHLHSFLVS